MRYKLKTLLKALLPPLLLCALGVGLVFYSTKQEQKGLQSFYMHTAAIALLQMGDPQSAYALLIQSTFVSSDPHYKAIALYEAANIGWVEEIADYSNLVGLYQQSLRYDPSLKEASFNLEYLYWLKQKLPEQLPQPTPDNQPSEERNATTGDV